MENSKMIQKLIKLLVVICCFTSYGNLYAIALESTKEGRAFENGDLLVVKKLIEEDKYFKGRENIFIVQAVYLAVKSGNLDLIKYLDSKGWFVICKKEKNCFPLHYSARLDYDKSLPMINFFMEREFNPLISNHGGMTPLHYAAPEGHIELVQYLCGLGVDPSQKESYLKRTAVRMAKNSADSGGISKQTRGRLKSVITYLESGECKKK